MRVFESMIVYGIQPFSNNIDQSSIASIGRFGRRQTASTVVRFIHNRFAAAWHVASHHSVEVGPVTRSPAPVTSEAVAADSSYVKCLHGWFLRLYRIGINISMTVGGSTPNSLKIERERNQSLVTAATHATSNLFHICIRRDRL